MRIIKLTKKIKENNLFDMRKHCFAICLGQFHGIVFKNEIVNFVSILYNLKAK